MLCVLKSLEKARQRNDILSVPRSKWMQILGISSLEVIDCYSRVVLTAEDVWVGGSVHYNPCEVRSSKSTHGRVLATRMIPFSKCFVCGDQKWIQYSRCGYTEKEKRRLPHCSLVYNNMLLDALSGFTYFTSEVDQLNSPHRLFAFLFLSQHWSALSLSMQIKLEFS